MIVKEFPPRRPGVGVEDQILKKSRSEDRFDVGLSVIGAGHMG